MPWKEATKMSIKQKFIEAILTEHESFAKICRDFKISRACGYKWYNRFKLLGTEGLVEKSRRPYTCLVKTPFAIERKILKVRALHPRWGGRKICAYLRNQGMSDIPTPSTVTRILHRHGKIDKKASEQATAFIRFEHEHPNQLWQMDFKGHFRLAMGQQCNPLTVLDDCSRYSLILEACVNQQELSVKTALINAFREYGVPERMTMDNGAPWGCRYGSKGFTTLEVWLILLGINPTHSRPYHPQTQGKDERFHRTLKEELLIGRVFTDFKDAQENFDRWRQEYNEERPHEAINLKPPASKYQPSQRRYPEKIPKIEYDMGAKVRIVQNHGDIFYKGQRYLVSASMAGLPVKLVESERYAIMEVYLCEKRVRELDLKNKTSARKIIGNV